MPDHGCKFESAMLGILSKIDDNGSMSNVDPHDPTTPQALGPYLKSARLSVGLSLRSVEAKTGVTNGYLSQIENQLISKPSPNVLFHLAELYGIDYSSLLERAGHRVPSASVSSRSVALNGIPLRALEDLNDSERKDLMDYLHYLKSKR